MMNTITGSSKRKKKSWEWADPRGKKEGRGGGAGDQTCEY